MGIDWGDYERLPPDLLVKPRDISRDEAWRRHRLRMKLLPERLEALTWLAGINGVLVGSRGMRDCDAVEDWVHDVVLDRFPVDDVGPRLRALEAELEALPPAERAARFPDGKALMEAVGYDPLHHPIYDPQEPVLSLIHDAGLLYGDELIARFPTLSWLLRRGSPRNVVYHHTVIEGFTRAARGYDIEVFFSYQLEMSTELWGHPRRRYWASMVGHAEHWA